MGTILFITIMAILIKINENKFWLWFVLILGLAVQCGCKIGIIGTTVWIGLARVLKDLFQAK